MFGWLGGKKRHSTSRPAPTQPIDPTLFERDGPSLFKALSSHWALSDPNTYTRHATRAHVEVLEARYSLQLPDDFRAYLTYAAPSVTFMDDIGTQWWAPSEIKSIMDECPKASPDQINSEIEQESEAYLVFSDYLIWSYAWAICCSNGSNRGKIALIGGLPDTFVADSFREFLRLQLADDLAIHQGPSKQAPKGG